MTQPASYSTYFMDYINIEIRQKLETLYGDKAPYLIDYEMRKIVKKKEEYIKRFGINELTDIMHGGFFNYDPTGLGYIYGYPLSNSWEWMNATINDDIETLERLTNNKEVEEAKYKASFIQYYADDLLYPHKTDNRNLKASNRNHETRHFNNLKLFLDDGDTWFLK